MCIAHDVKQRSKAVIGVQPHVSKPLPSKLQLPELQKRGAHKKSTPPNIERNYSGDTATTIDIAQISESYDEEIKMDYSFEMIPSGGLITMFRENRRTSACNIQHQIRSKPNILPRPNLMDFSPLVVCPRDTTDHCTQRTEELLAELDDLLITERCVTPPPMEYDPLWCPPSPQPYRKIVRIDIPLDEDLTLPFL
jgi:hypothetical protein